MKMDRYERARLLRMPKPFHEEPEPFSCTCVSCESWRAARVVTGSMVTGIKRKDCDELNTPSWKPGGPMVWDRSVMDLMLVLGDVPEKSPGGYLDPVLLWSEKTGFRVMPKKWLLVVIPPAQMKDHS